MDKKYSKNSIQCLGEKKLQDIRQTSEYACFMEKLGWKTKIINNNYLYLKKLPIIPFSIAKLLKPNHQIQLNELKKTLKNTRCLFIKIQLPSVKINPGVDFAVDKHPLIPTKTIWIDLKQSLKEILKKMKQKTRYNIRKTKRSNLKTTIIPGNKINKKQRKLFYSLWSQNKPFNWLFKPNFNELKYITDCFGKRCFFIFASTKHQLLNTNHLIAGALILTSNNMSFYWHNFSNRKGKKLFAPSLIIWETIKESRKRNLKIFDLEGIFDQRFSKQQKGWKGFSRFKKGFGGKVVKFPNPLILKQNFLTLFN